MVGSPPQAKPDPRVFGKPIFYGWWLVAINCVLGALGGGVYTFGISAFIVPLSEEFDVGRGTISWAVALASLEGAVLGPVLGFMVDRFGPRKVMYFGITMMGIGYILSSWAPSITWFFILFVPLVAIGSGAGLFSPPAAAIGNWFVRKRALAFSISMSGWGVGGVMVILTNFLVQTLGWREAMLILGLTVMAVAYPMAGFVRHRPEQYGYYPDGSRVPPEQPTASARPGTGTEIDFTVKEALSSAAFWLIGISFAARMFAVAGVSSHFIPMMQAKGFSAEAGASLLAMYGIATIPSRVLFGYLGDRISKVGIVGAMGGLMAVAMLVLAVSDGLGMTVFAILMYATAWGRRRRCDDARDPGRVLRKKEFRYHCGVRQCHPDRRCVLGPDLRRVHLRYHRDLHRGPLVVHWLRSDRHAVYAPGPAPSAEAAARDRGPVTRAWPT